MPLPIRIAASAVVSLMALVGCQSAGPAATATPHGTGIFEQGTASAKAAAEAEAEASALGTAQGVASIAASLDKTGASSIPLMIGGKVAREGLRAKWDARMKAAQEEDLQATYRYYGMNPDGTPSGKPGPGSAPEN
ncbi:hypothetical protein [Microvirga rosea]|uniref:hypothetical protein n=1 Tax=Microvirga rosea TaxID=2715425 RepID=UPI001D0B2624|nr:hypothetical protein [Microvirga rosea]MCB8819760.1 hypothetical protein [Microvirga rosea]